MMAETLKTVEAVTPEKIIKTSQIEVELKHTIPPVFLKISSVIRAIKKEYKMKRRNCWRMWLTQQRKHRRRGELLRRLQLEKYESVFELDVGELQDLIDTANDGVAFVWPIGIPNIGAALELRNIWILEEKMEAKAAAAGA
jgi:hypothetical protein